jgi:hypothetical protein
MDILTACNNIVDFAAYEETDGLTTMYYMGEIIGLYESPKTQGDWRLLGSCTFVTISGMEDNAASPHDAATLIAQSFAGVLAEIGLDSGTPGR